MKLNLGCGDRYVPGWTNVDLPAMPHRKDQAVDLAGDLPWEHGSIDCVYAGHVLEHLHPADVHGLLKRLQPLMKPNAPIMLVGPDVDRGRQLLPDGISDEYGVTLDMLRYGAGRWSGDIHQWECTEKELASFLDDTGWASVVPLSIDEVALNWPVADPRPRWQCAVGALNPWPNRRRASE